MSHALARKLRNAMNRNPAGVQSLNDYFRYAPFENTIRDGTIAWNCGTILSNDVADLIKNLDVSNAALTKAKKAAVAKAKNLLITKKAYASTLGAEAQSLGNTAKNLGHNGLESAIFMNHRLDPLLFVEDYNNLVNDVALAAERAHKISLKCHDLIVAYIRVLQAADY